ncbi:flavodoxin [Lactiplantibacillus plantarum]|nr:flavodoxin [Lactiplantibacillus plantarum]
MNDYETIYLGFPTWWYQPPMVIHTFLLNINFLDKRLYRSLPVLVVQLRQVPKY